MNSKISTVISRGKKSAFVPFVKIAENVIDLRWGKKDEVEKVGHMNEETGKWEYTGEIRDTDYCTYEMTRWYGELNDRIFVSKILPAANRKPSMYELNQILIELGSSDENRRSYLREHLIELASVYGSSRDTVDQFYIGDYNTWIDKATRVGLSLRFESEMTSGLTDTVLWQDGISFPLNVNVAIQMLAAIELYASACYDNTHKHLAYINKLETIEDILQYDFTVGYPDILHF